MKETIKRCVRKLASGDKENSTAELVKALTELGLPYEEQSGEVFLKESLELLDAEVVGRQISTEPTLEIHWSIDSTNTYLMRKEFEPDAVLVCLAEQQQAGKGRRGKSWISPFGQNIYLSVAKRFTRSLADLSGLSLVAGMQVVNTLRSLGLQGAGLKWPNDVLMGKGKLAGILVELGPPTDRHVSAVVGIGINFLLHEQDSQKIDQPWSSVLQFASVSRNEMAGTLIENLLQAFERFEDRGFAAFHSQWDEYNLYKGQQIVIHRGTETVEGKDGGIDEHGNLILETRGGCEVFHAGEVSLRSRA